MTTMTDNLRENLRDAAASASQARSECETLISWAEDAEATMAFVLDWLALQHGDERGVKVGYTTEYHRCMARLRSACENRP